MRQATAGAGGRETEAEARSPTAARPPLRVLIVAEGRRESREIRAALTAGLPPGTTLRSVPDLPSAERLLARSGIDAVLLAAPPAGPAPEDVLGILCSAAPETPVVVLGDADVLGRARELVRAGAQDCLARTPLDPQRIAHALELAVERHALRSALRERERTAALASASKTRFIASVSHDIRAPLGAMLGMVDLLLGTEIDGEQHNYVRTLQRSGRALVSLLNNVLELSSLESGQFALRHARVRLADLMDDVGDMFAFTAHKKRLALVLELDPDLPESFDGDAARLRQICSNLVGNAAKYTERGFISLSARRVPGDGRDGLRLEVADSGPGIPPDERDRMFESFVQGEGRLPAEHGGVGLGLAICQELIRRMDGHLRLLERPGGGSRFIVDLPLREGSGRAAPEGRPLEGERCLLAVASQAERKAMARALAHAGAEVRETGNARDALAFLRGEAGAEGGPGLVIADCRLPGGGGLVVLDAAQESGSSPRRLALLPVDHRPGDVPACRALGAEALQKPLVTTTLLRRLAGEEPAAEATLIAEPAPDVAGTRVLVVEDSTDLQALLQAWLEVVGCEVTLAGSGRQAREQLAARAFDVVLMDVELPDGSGLEVTGDLRAREQTEGLERTPVLAVTGHAFREQAEACLAAGCDAHLTKPVERLALLRAMAEHARKAHGRERRAPETSPPGDDIAALVPGYLENRRRDLALLQEALGRADLETAARIGHRVKGSGASYGLPRLGRIGAQLESFARAGRIEDVLRCVAELAAAVEAAAALSPAAGPRGHLPGSPCRPAR